MRKREPIVAGAGQMRDAGASFISASRFSRSLILRQNVNWLDSDQSAGLLVGQPGSEWLLLNRTGSAGELVRAAVPSLLNAARRDRAVFVWRAD
jgi:hypothetical protein